jgi:hypothetical protein
VSRAETGEEAPALCRQLSCHPFPCISHERHVTCVLPALSRACAAPQPPCRASRAAPHPPLRQLLSAFSLSGSVQLEQKNPTQQHMRM